MTDQLSLDELLELGKKVKEWEHQSPHFTNEIIYTGTHQDISVEILTDSKYGDYDPIFRISAFCVRVELGVSKYKTKTFSGPNVGDPRVKAFYEHIDKMHYQQANSRERELQEKQKKLLEQGSRKLLEHVRQLIKEK